MQILPAVTIAVLILAALLISIFKGSRPPQPLPLTPTPTRNAVIAAFVPPLSVLIVCATFRGVEAYTRTHLVPPMPLVILFLGILALWCVGLYFAYVTSCAANKVLRTVGALEMLTFLLAGGLALLSR